MSTTPLTDPREMRRAITEASHGDRSVSGEVLDWKTSARRPMSAPCAPLIRNVLMAAERAGWSGEDTMTALAYHALLANEKLYEQNLEMAMLAPPRGMVLVDPPGAAFVPVDQYKGPLPAGTHEIGTILDPGGARANINTDAPVRKPW